MNHIYRSLWNEKTGTFVAVSEITQSGKKASAGGGGVVGAGFALKALAVSLLLAFGSNVYALPSDGVVAAGNATIATRGANSMTITQASQNAALNWQHFNIGQGEAVRFVQPNSNAVALNRVLGTDPSSILGSLSANGKVFLVNPNGILFGAGASVNVGGLVASTRNISDSDFMAGNYKFAGSGSGSVVNQGSIHADGGYVALLGANVSNDGVIAARMGTVALAAGNTMTLDVAGDGLLNVSVDQGAVKALVNNGGMIQADGGQVLMTAQAAGSLLQTAVNNTGIVQAQTIENHNGTIRLLGDMQSGTVNVGGTLDASAPNGGNGGFIDTSAAHVKVAADTRVTTAAAQGLTGSWLIDPTDYTIAASGGDITGTQLSTNLGSTDITIQSTSGGSGSAGDVNVNDAVTWSANKLTLNAQNNININANLNASSTASLALEFGQSAVAAGNTSNVVTTNASVNLPAGTTNFTTKQGSDGSVKAYTVITSPGAAGSTTTTDLQGMNGNLALNYALGADIDASATSGWNSGAGFLPIGGSGCWPCSKFIGTFDGLGHTISSLTINRSSTSMIGLFGYGTAATVIRNIGLSGGSITGASYTGSIIGRNAGTVSNSYATLNVTGTGYVGGLVGRNYGTISNSYATGNVSGSRVGGLVGRSESGTSISNSHATGSVTGSQYAGGLVGVANPTTISNCYATGNVTSSFRHAGGLVGQLGGGSISNSYATGTVSGVGWTGGLVGDGSSVTISNSYATGNVTGTNQRTGGLFGYGDSFTVSNSYATGTVNGTDKTGGLAGYMYNGSVTNTYATGAVTGTTNVGGLVGYAYSGSVTRSYSVGAVSGTSTIGGLVGAINSTSFSNSYWNTTTSGQSSSAGGTGRTSTQMQTASNFGGFTFTTTGGATGNNWVMVDTDGTLNNAGSVAGATYPMLASEYSTTITNSHQLQLMAMAQGASYTLGANVNAATTGTSTDVWGSTGFVPVGNVGNTFTGSLNGAGHTISGLTINRSGVNYAGLFGYADSASNIQNVGLVGGSVVGNRYTGALVGYKLGSVSNSFSTAGVTGGYITGGLVGGNYGGAISSSYATGTVNGDFYVGGLAGINYGSPTISDSYATGGVTGNRYVGGLVGATYGTSVVDKSYSTGNVNGAAVAGGLVGKQNTATISNSFWDTTTSALATSSGGTGMATADMQTQANFTSATAANGNANPAWDVTNTWVIYDGHTYPLLRTFMTPLTVTAGDASKTYDGAVYSGGGSVTYSTTPNGNLLGTPSYSYGSANAGTSAIVASGLYSTQQQGGYAIDYVGGTLTINKANLTISTSDVSKTYDGTLTAAGTATVTSGTLYSNASNGGTLDSLSGGTFAFTNANVGTNKTVTTSGVTLSDGNSGGNYNVSYANNTTSTIGKANLTLGGTRAYDGTSAVAGSVLTANGVAGETFAVTGAGDTSNLASKNVQSGSTLSSLTGLALGSSGNGGLAGNYNALSTAGSSVSITKANLTLGGTRAYDGTSAVAGSVLTANGVAGETFAVTGAGDTSNLASKNVQSGSTLSSLTGLALGSSGNGGLAGNYNALSTAGSSVSITKANLTLGGTRAYDGTSAVAGSVLTANGVAGETFTVTGAGDTSNLASKNVQSGSTLASLTGLVLGSSGNGGLAGNYNALSTAGSSVSLTKANLVVGTSDVTKTYDGTLGASGSATVTGGTLFGSDSVSGGTFAFTDANAGSNKTVTTTGVTVTDGNSGGNYNVSYANNTTSTIGKAGLTLGGTRAYDGTSAVAGSVLTASGVHGETFAVTGAGDTSNLASKNVQSGSTLASLTGLVLGSSGNGGLAGNYNALSTAGSSVSLTKANLVVGTSDVTKTYDGTLGASGSATVTGGTLFGSDSVSGGTFAFTNANAGSNKTVTTTGVTVADGNSGGNYNVSYANNTTSTIGKAGLTLGGTRAYDGTSAVAGSVLTASGVHGETFAVTGAGDTSNLASKNVQSGSTLASLTGLVLGSSSNGGLAGNYNALSTAGSSVSLTKANLVVGTSDVTKTYDGTLGASGSATVTGGTLFGSDSVSGGTFAFTNANAGSNKTVTTTGVTVTDGNSGGNYNVSYANNTTSTIGKAGLTLSSGNVSKTYDGTLAASGSATVASGTLYHNASNSGTLDSVSGGTFAFTNANAGSNKTVTTTGVTVTDGNSGGNYNVSYADNIASTINKANLTLSTGNVTKTYDGTLAASGSATVASGTLYHNASNSGTLDSLSGGTFAFTDANAGSNKTVTTTGVTVTDGNSGGNYNVSYANNTTSTIGKAGLTLGGTRAYDGTSAVAGSVLTASGVHGETFAVTGAGDTSNLASKNVQSGSTLASLTGLVLGSSGNGGLAGNYNALSTAGSSVSLTKANLVVGTSDVTKTYDGTLGASGSATVTGGTLFGSDSVSGGTFAFTDANAGSNKTVTTTGVTVTDGNSGGNYNVSYANNTTSTIGKAGLTLSSGNVSKTYDGTLAASGSATVASGTLYHNASNSGTLDSVSGGTFAFTNANAGSNKTVTTSGVTVTDGNSGGNYNVSYADNIASTINKANLTLSTGNVTKTYDGTLAASGSATVASGTLYHNASNSGTLDSLSGGTFAFTDANAGSSKTVTTTGVTVADGNSGGNYNVSYADNTGSTINKANLMLSTGNVTKTYDGTLAASGSATVASGTLYHNASNSGTLDSLSGGTFAFTDANAGSSKTVTTTGVTVADGNSGGNYNVSYANNTAGTINKANLTLSTGNVTKTYDGTLAASGSATVASGTLYHNASNSGTLDSLSGGTFAFTDANAGSSKTVTTTGVTVTDGNGGGNYNVSYADNTASTINKANLMLSTGNVTKSYDGTLAASGSATVASGTLYYNASNGGTLDRLSGGTFAFTNANAGSNKTVTTTGVTVTDGNGGGNYNVSYADNTASTINKANLMLSTSNVTKTYDGTLAASGSATVASGTLYHNASNSGTLDRLSGGTFAFTNANAGSNKTVTTTGVTVADGNGGGNYNVNYADNTASIINKANLMLSTGNVTKTYDGTLAASGSATVVSGTLYHNASNSGTLDSLSGGTFAFTNANAGSNKTVTTTGVTVADGNGGGNYNVSYADNTASIINKANLTLSTGNVTKTYDGTLAASGSATVASGTLYHNASNSGTLDSLSGGTFAFTDANAGSSKTVTTTGVTVADGNSGGNYNVSYADNTTSTINQANLMLSTGNVTKTYDGTLAAAGSATVASGTLYHNASNGGTLDSLSGGTFAFTDANAGSSKTVTTTGVTVTDGNGGGNYNVSYADNTAGTINPAVLTATMHAADKTYDGTTAAAASLTIASGLVGTETLNATGSATFNSKDVATANLVTLNHTSLANGTGLASNYSLAAGQTAAASITPAALSITGITAANKVYDGTRAATIDTGTATYAGLMQGDTVAVSASGLFADKNAAIGKTIALTSHYSGADAGNYTIADQATTTADITPKALAIGGITAANRPYDGTTAATIDTSAATYAGLVTGDAVAVNATGVFDNKNVGTGKTVTLTSHYLGADTGNYAIADQATTTADITPAIIESTKAQGAVTNAVSTSSAAPTPPAPSRSAEDHEAKPTQTSGAPSPSIQPVGVTGGSVNLNGLNVTLVGEGIKLPTGMNGSQTVDENK